MVSPCPELPWSRATLPIGQGDDGSVKTFSDSNFQDGHNAIDLPTAVPTGFLLHRGLWNDGPALDRALEGRRDTRFRTNAGVAFVGFRLVVRVLRSVIATAGRARGDIVVGLVTVAVATTDGVAVDCVVNRIASNDGQGKANGH